MTHFFCGVVYSGFFGFFLSFAGKLIEVEPLDAAPTTVLLVYQLVYIVHAIYVWKKLKDDLPTLITKYGLLVFTLLPVVVCAIVYPFIFEDMVAWDVIIIYIIMFGYILLSIAVMSLVNMHEELR